MGNHLKIQLMDSKLFTTLQDLLLVAPEQQNKRKLAKITNAQSLKEINSDVAEFTWLELKTKLTLRLSTTNMFALTQPLATMRSSWPTVSCN